jgi:hypothetical protein
MKKLFPILLLAIGLLAVGPIFNDASAQLSVVRTPTTAKDSLVNADQLFINLTPPANDAIGFHVTGNRASGTVEGKVYLQGSLDGVNFKSIDSVTLTNTAYVFASFNTKYELPYARYRALYAQTGTVKVTGIRGHIIRRAR